MSRLLVLPPLLVALACGSQPPAPTPTPVSDALSAPPTEQDVVQDALPAIVLVVNQREDKKTVYGAGFFDVEGRILTANHVVDLPGQVSVMLFRPGRATYSPMDGGIMRFLFENGRELMPARVVRADAVADLAALEPARSLGEHASLRWSESGVRPGDRIYALGHPQETPWSFSAGVVGALQYGLIQHDATVGPGSSGGPLLNQRGEVVGVNVAQVVSEPVGLSFARPGHVVSSALGGRPHEHTIDLSSASSAALTCWRAQELALREVAECFDWETDWRQFVALVEEAAAHIAAEDARARLLGCGQEGAPKERWVQRRKDHVVRALDPTNDKKRTPDLDPADPELPGPVAELLREGLEIWRRGELADGTVEGDFRDVARLRTRLRKGLRVEDTRKVAPDREWVMLASVNADGTLAHFSELYVKIGERWLQRGQPWPEEVAQLPSGWPEPLETFALKRSLSLALLVKRALHGEVCADKPPANQST